MTQSFTKSVPLDTDVTLSGDSNGVTPSQHAVKTYVDNKIAGVPAPYPGIGMFAQDEGVPLSTGTTMNFVGGGVVASISGTIIQVTVPPEYENFWNSGTQGNYAIRAKNDSTVNALGNYAFAIGQNSIASGAYSYAQGFQTKAINVGASAEGNLTIASGVNSHAEGNGAIASGNDSHAEGSGIAIGDTSHAEGLGSKAYGAASHAEGVTTVASGTYSFAGGNANHAIGVASAALGGRDNRVLGNNSVVLGGSGTVATYDDTVFVPKLNIRNIQTGTPLLNLGADVNGNVVIGTTGSSSSNVLLDMQTSTYTNQTGTTATIPGDDTIPQNTEGAQVMTVSITPKSASSRLEIDAVLFGATNPQLVMNMALFRDNTADAIAVSSFYPPGGNTTFTFPLHAVVTAGSTSPTTFKIRIGTHTTGAAYINGTSGGRAFGATIKSSITVREYSA